MARFLKGIHGAYSGKVGNVIGSNWRSVDYVRSLARPSKKPATDLQLAQRQRFGLAIGFLSPIKDLLNLGFSDKLQGRSTGYNKALQYAIQHAVIGDYPNFELDYSAVQIAKGGLGKLMGVSWTETAPGTVTVSWENRTNKYTAFGDDVVLLLVFNKEKLFFDILESGSRQDESLEITFPAVYAGDHMVGWIFTGRRDGVKTSSSDYLGEIVVSS